MAKWHNVVMTVEVMVEDKELGELNDSNATRVLRESIKCGMWFHVTGAKVVHTTEEAFVVMMGTGPEARALTEPVGVWEEAAELKAHLRERFGYRLEDMNIKILTK